MSLFYGAPRGATWGPQAPRQYVPAHGQLVDGTLSRRHVTPMGNLNPVPVFQAPDNRPSGPPVVVNALEHPRPPATHALGRFLTAAELFRSIRR